MKNKLITFTEEEARDKAEQYFISYCGLDLSTEKHSRMYKDAMEVRGNGIDGIGLSALVSSFGPQAFVNHKIVVGDIAITCEAFSQIPDENVIRVYLYLITAGGCNYDDDDPVIKQLYADIWGTVYVDVGRDLLENVIKEDAKIYLRNMNEGEGYLSTAISPGFFGMATEASKNISSILSGHDVGISVRDNGVMLPLKTCSGVYLLVKDPDGMPLPECKTCIGNPGGCALCKVMDGKKR